MFENVPESPLPVAINLFGSAQRMAWALGVESREELNQRLSRLIDLRLPHGLRETVGCSSQLLGALFATGLKPKKVRKVPVQQIDQELHLKLKLALMLALFSLLLGACAPSAPSQGATPTAGLDLAHPVTLRLALLPILDALPIYVAQERGFFEAAGLQVTFVAANSAVERDQLMAADQADGMINDLVSAVLYDRDQVQVQVVRFAQLASPGFPVYRIVASQQSGIKDLNGLRGVEIGISQGSVIDYVTDRLLQAAGFSPQEINTIAIPKIADCLSLLASGGLKAATLPEPFASEAVKAGGTVILDDSAHPELGNSVISFRKSFIDANPAAIQAFLTAVDEAVVAIDADPTAWAGVLGKYNLLPADLLASYRLPPFPVDSWPTQSQFEDVVAWATAKQLISKPVDYSQAIYLAFR